MSNSRKRKRSEDGEAAPDAAAAAEASAAAVAVSAAAAADVKSEEDPKPKPQRPPEVKEDPDYAAARFNHSMQERQKIRKIEQDAKAKVVAKVTEIINREFMIALRDKETELEKIDSTIFQVQKALHLVRYGAITNYYSATVPQQVKSEPENVAIHPAIRRLLGGKCVSQNPAASEKTEEIKKEKGEKETEKLVFPVPKTLPGYVPPKNKESGLVVPEPRGSQYKIKRRFIVGNVSKWIQCDEREDRSTHKWMIYVRGDKDHPDVSDVVSKVRFLIHPSYHPHDLVEIKEPPFHLTRRGWGEFPARVQIHFKHNQDKPVDVIHNLKLDKSYTGLQTLGSETVVDIWLHNPEFHVPRKEETKPNEEEALADAGGFVIRHSEEKDLRRPPKEQENGKIFSKPQNPPTTESGGQSLLLNNKRKETTSTTSTTTSKTGDADVAKPQTTFIRCTDKDGKVYYLPVTLLPNNQQKQVVGGLSQPSLIKPQRKPPHSIRTKLSNGQLSVNGSPNLGVVTASSAATAATSLKPLSNGITSETKLPMTSRTEKVSASTGQKLVLLQDGQIHVVKSCPNSRNGGPEKQQQNTLIVPPGASLLSSRLSATSSSSSISAPSSPCRSLVTSAAVPPGTSLLRRVVTPSPAPEPAFPIPIIPSTLHLTDLEKSVPEISLATWKTILGRSNDETQSEIENRVAKKGVHLLKKQTEYLAFLSTKVLKLKPEEFPSLERMINYIAKFLPLVTPVAKDPLYRAIHPYSAGSVEDYLSWNRGKQFASEWLRAKTIQRIIQRSRDISSDKSSSSSSTMTASTSPLLTARFIWKHLRESGFSILPTTKEDCSTTSPPPINLSWSTFTFAGSDLGLSETTIDEEISKSELDETESIIDVECVKAENKNKKKDIMVAKKKPPASLPTSTSTMTTTSTTTTLLKGTRIHLLFPEDNNPTFKFVKETAKEIGIHLEEEELSKKVFYPAAQKLIFKAAKNLCETIIRQSYKESWNRCQNDRRRQPSPPMQVELADVRKAVRKDPLLALLTNKGLGVTPKQE